MNRLRRKNKRARNNLMGCLCFVFLSFLISSTLALAREAKNEKSPIEVEAAVDRNSISIGDKIRYRIRVKTRKDIEVEFPSFAENLAGFAIKDFGSAERGFLGKKTLVQWYLLDTYTTGKYTIPKATIKYRRKNQKQWQEIETNELKVEVKSVLEKGGKATDIRDIKDPVDFPGKVNPYLILAACVLLGAGGFLWVFLARKKEKKEIIPPRPAHEIAYERLEELKKKDLLSQGRVKEFYFELSLIVRYYLEDRFDLRAPEMTTEEFLLKVKDSQKLSYEHKGVLRDFLSHCDLVKFAKYGPSDTEINSSLESAKKLIDDTRPEVREEIPQVKEAIGVREG
ncbi:MAG: BatD family protein [bacterium]